jgi:hypothetical protein
MLYTCSLIQGVTNFLPRLPLNHDPPITGTQVADIMGIGQHDWAPICIFVVQSSVLIEWVWTQDRRICVVEEGQSFTTLQLKLEISASN